MGIISSDHETYKTQKVYFKYIQTVLPSDLNPWVLHGEGAHLEWLSPYGILPPYTMKDSSCFYLLTVFNLFFAVHILLFLFRLSFSSIRGLIHNKIRPPCCYVTQQISMQQIGWLKGKG
jgi:hypothetical protein